MSSSTMCAASFVLSVLSMVVNVVLFHLSMPVDACSVPSIEAFRTKTKAWAVRPRFQQRHLTPTERQI